MVDNIITLANIKKEPKKTKQDYTGEGFSFENQVEKDISKLCDATGISREEAINMAKNFYRKYPMLIEFVRTPNELLRR